MQDPFNPLATPAVLTDHMIGSAYATVREVARNMEFVKHVSYYMPQLYAISGDLAALVNLNTNTQALLNASDVITSDFTSLQAQITLYSDRANQVGVQTAATISNFSEAVDDRVAGLLVAGTNVTLVYNDAANTLTISSAGSGGGGGGDASAVVFTPAGSVSATNVQAAIQELDTEKEPVIAGGTNIQFWNGSKAWTDFATTVRATVLTSISFASSTAIVAADTVLGAFGKLQAQITGLASSKLDANANAVSATRLATARNINGVAFDGTTNITIADSTKVATSLIGAADGIVPLGSDSKIASTYLPSYVDDVLEVANFAALPVTGETGKIYITIDTNFEYRWTGSAYLQIVSSPGTTDSLAEGTTNKYWTAARTIGSALTGFSAVNTVVVAADTILSAISKLQGQVSAKLDASANAVSATKLVTARTINTVSFDGTANITIVDATKQPLDTDLTSIAALVSAADTVPYATGAGTWALTALTSVGRTLLAATTAALQRTALGLSAAATAAASVSTTWTPQLQFGAANVGMAATVVGTYARIGSLIYIKCRITLTAKGSSTGNASITGLPFSVNVENQGLQLSAYANMASIVSPFAQASFGTTIMALVQHGAAGHVNMTDANFTNTSVIVVTGVYDMGSLT